MFIKLTITITVTKENNKKVIDFYTTLSKYSFNYIGIVIYLLHS